MSLHTRDSSTGSAHRTPECLGTHESTINFLCKHFEVPPLSYQSQCESSVAFRENGKKSTDGSWGALQFVQSLKARSPGQAYRMSRRAFRRTARAASLTGTDARMTCATR